MHSPADASRLPSRAETHGLGPMRVATPSSCRTCTDYSLPVSRRTNYPRPMSAAVSGTDGGEDGAEDGGAGRQAGGVDDGADRGLALSGPHRTVAIGDFALDHGGTQCPLTGVVGGLDQPRMINKGQELLTGAADFGLKCSGQVTRARSGEDVSQLPLQ